MRRRVGSTLVVGAVLAACNAITNIGDYTFDGTDAAPEASANDGNTASSEAGRDANVTVDANADAAATADASADAGADASADADADADATDADAGTADADAGVVDTGAPDADASTPVTCDLPSPSTGNRIMECGDGTCDLDTTSPPLQCCSGADASDGTCVLSKSQCPTPKFVWQCSRAYQCPFPSFCCLAVRELSQTCPPTAKATESSCIGPSDAGCLGNLELCTGNEPCVNGGKCTRLEIIGQGARVIGACL